MALRPGRSLSGLLVDLIDLRQPVARGRLDLLARPSDGARLSERMLGCLLRLPDRAWIGGGDRGIRLGEMVVVRPLGGAQGVDRLLCTGPGSDGNRAPLVRDASLIRTRVCLARLVGGPRRGRRGRSRG